MAIDWRAVGLGFVLSVALGLIGGATIPFTDVSLPALSSVLTGLVAGFGAGYVAGGDWARGALHGGLSVIIGALVVVILLGILGTIAAGLLGLGATVVALLFLLLYAIPGALGGVVGALVKRRRAPTGVSQPLG